MDFYAQLESALLSGNINTKELIVNEAIEYLRDHEAAKENTPPLVFDRPSYAAFCTIVSPKELPRRSDFSKREALAALVHSIAHIEFSAIDLALDAVYRFRGLPKEYQLDWLIVAQDEIRHFKMLHSILEKLGLHYGDIVVHQGLFEMSMKSSKSAIERMAIIPRYFEATGLDVNPKIIKKLESYKKDPLVSELIDALHIIYKEEIEHVSKGDKWFKYLCAKEKSDFQERFLAIIEKYHLKSRAEQFNIEGRKEAGFSCQELLNLGAKKCEESEK